MGGVKWSGCIARIRLWLRLPPVHGVSVRCFTGRPFTVPCFHAVCVGGGEGYHNIRVRRKTECCKSTQAAAPLSPR